MVCACDAAAAAAGIAPGMALNSALALLPELQTLARDPQRERELLSCARGMGLAIHARA